MMIEDICLSLTPICVAHQDTFHKSINKINLIVVLSFSEEFNHNLAKLST